MREARRRAALRFRHDVGKALRWSAPEPTETAAESLRERLRRDLRPPSGSGPIEKFDAWLEAEGDCFSGDGDSTAVLARLSVAMDEVRRGAARLDLLEGAELVRLDEACREAARAGGELRSISGPGPGSREER